MYDRRMTPPPPKHIAIIGAGPAGLWAAEELARVGCVVTVYDRMPSPARKFLIAGRGGLNLTHSEPLETFVARYGIAQEWLAPMIDAHPPDALRAWCEGLGEPTFVGSSGRVFPRSMKAVQLLRAWLQRLEGLGVHYAPRHTWWGWQDGALHFTCEEKGAAPCDVLVRADATLLALGGASWPRLGSDGGWVNVVAQEGVRVAPLRPANMGFVVPWSAHVSSRFAGMPIKPVAIAFDGMTQQGEAMITQAGIEGGVVYALSSALRDGIEKHGSAQITLDLRPDMTHAALTKKLLSPRGNKSLSAFLRGQGFAPVALGLLRESKTQHELAAADAAQLAAWLKAVPVMLTAPAGIARAISSAGGIALSELDDACMLKRKAGVFVAGEMLDWEAPTGGYLLQACYSTAMVAAAGMKRYLS